MGLLKKANKKILPKAILKTNSISKNSNNKKKNHIELFLTQIYAIKPGFEYSNDLFNSISDLLNISKGALLVRESESVTFVPSSFINIDITTIRHLRINASILDDQFNKYNEIINISNKSIKLFKQYISIREFAALTSLILIPLYLRGTLSALLLIIDPSEQVVSIAKEISLNSEKFTNKLIKSRIPFNKLNKSIDSELKLEPTTILENYIDGNKSLDITFLIIKINFSRLRDNLIELLPNTDSFEISNNIIKSITQLVNPTGKLIKINSENYLLFYKIKNGKTSGIILHQINLAISSFFNISNSLPNIEAEITAFQSNESNSAKIMLEGII